MRISTPKRPARLERIPLSGGSTFTVREFVEPAFRYPWHQHNEFELTWIRRGHGLRYVGDCIEAFHEGDFCLLGGSLPHTWLSSKDSRSRARSLVIQFDPERWGGDFLRIPELARVAALLRQAAGGLHFSAPRGILAESLCQLLDRSSPWQHFRGLLDILEKLGSRKARTLSHRHPRPVRPHDDRRLHKVMAYLTENQGRQISQAEAARLVGLAPPNFSRFFRRAVGRTFQSYVIELRLSEVCRQLVETDCSISEIAFAAGFENLSNFNRAFRLSRGISPSLYRQRIRPLRVHSD